MNNNWLSLTTALAGIFLIIALTGCAGKTHIEPIKSTLTIPPQMFQCVDSGPRPTGNVILESQVARYISTLEFSNRDCKTQLKELQVVVKCFNDPKCDVDKIIEYVGLVEEAKPSPSKG